VAQGVGPEFKPQYYTNNNKKDENYTINKALGDLIMKDNNSEIEIY
jgi:hypothetical protein